VNSDSAIRRGSYVEEAILASNNAIGHSKASFRDDLALAISPAVCETSASDNVFKLLELGQQR